MQRLAQLVTVKGHKDVSAGDICKTFGLAGRAEDGQCISYQLPLALDDDDDVRRWKYSKGWTISFNSFVERGTNVQIVILVAHNAKRGHVFLVSARGELQKTANMTRNRYGGWEYASVAVTPATKAIAAKDVTNWIEIENDIAALPDRRTAK